MRVQAYRNLTRNKWSLKVSGKVVGHCSSLTLSAVTVRLSEKSRQRLLAKPARDVHAWLEGELTSVTGFVPFEGRSVTVSGDVLPVSGRTITYHPFERSDFFYHDDASTYGGGQACEFGADMKVRV